MDRSQTTAAAAGVTSALVFTKIDPPEARSGFLPRPRLVAMLSGTERRRFTLIDAPAGWGKTSLTAAWSANDTERRAFAWVSLDEGDNDEGQFWSYVIAALRLVRPARVTMSPETPRMPGVHTLRDVVPSLINDFRAVEDETVLVLDDYHEIEAASIHHAVGYLVDRLPPSLQLAIVTRTDPPLPLGRLRASGAMTEIRAKDLQFTEAEASTLLNESLALGLAPEEVRVLWQRTEGWPAGLYLAGLSIRDRTDAGAFVEEFAGDDRNIVDYLTDEVLDGQTSQRRQFLLSTSILDRLTGSLCDEVVEITGSQETLEEIERANLFLVPLDTTGTWFRYHHLFGEWLRHELYRNQPDIVSGLHSRASRWHRRHRSYERAIDHALAADDLDEAADVIEESFFLTDYGRRSSMTSRLAAIPDDMVAARPRLALARSHNELVVGHIDDATRWLAVAEEGIDGSDDLERSPDGEYLFVKGFHRRVTCDIGRAGAAARRGLAAETDKASLPYALALRLLAGVTFWESGPAEALPLVRESLRRFQRLGMSDQGETATLALILAECGDFEQAEQTAHRAFRLAEDVPGQYPVTAAAHFALGRVLAAKKQPNAARQEVRQGINLALLYGEPLLNAYGLLILADLADDPPQARTHLREAQKLIEGLPDAGRLGRLVAQREQSVGARRRLRTVGTVHVEDLTRREHEVLRCLASHLSMREIARELYISHNTIKGYVKNIYRKLGVSSRGEALNTARDLGLL